MKIEHVRLDPASGHTLTIIVGAPALEQCKAGATLRCGAYRFVVESFIQHYAEASIITVSVLLSGRNAPVEGMLLHGVDEPLTDEEFAAALQHLLMVPRLLMGIDAAGVRSRLEATTLSIDRHSPLFQRVCLLAALTDSVSDTTDGLPALSSLAEIEHYKSEILKAC